MRAMAAGRTKAAGWSKTLMGRLFVAGLLLMVVVSPQVAFGAAFRCQDPHPSGLVRVTRPTLSLKLVPSGATRVTSVSMTLNAAPVSAVYAQDTHQVWYQPSQPLPPGDYAVTCRVILDDAVPFDRAWHFTVAPDAVSTLPEPTDRQQTLFEAVNAIRRSLGAPPFGLDQALSAAAQAHSRYALDNPSEDFHEEQTARPDATGARPQDRAAAFGFGDSVSEAGIVGTFSLATTPVVRMFDAPYHRLPFLHPQAGALGTGAAGKLNGDLATTLLFEQKDTVATVVSPAAGQQEVPTRWYGHESPDPLRLHPSHSLPVGYPLVLARFGPLGSRITVTGASLTTESGKAIAFFLNTPTNDTRLANAAFVIPQQPLEPHRTYHVTVQAMTSEGQNVSQDWHFTTGADNTHEETEITQEPRFRPASAASLVGVVGASLQIVQSGPFLQVTFPKTITRLTCCFDDATVPTKSSPPVHEAGGSLVARYPIPPDAHTYRLVSEQGTDRRVVTGMVGKLKPPD